MNHNCKEMSEYWTLNLHEGGEFWQAEGPEWGSYFQPNYCPWCGELLWLPDLEDEKIA